jgi:hypothetical protein
MAKRMTTLEGIYIRLYVKDKMDSHREHLDKAPGDMWWKYLLSRRLSRRYKSSAMLCNHCALSKYRLLFAVWKGVASRKTWIFKTKLILLSMKIEETSMDLVIFGYMSEQAWKRVMFYVTRIEPPPPDPTPVLPHDAEWETIWIWSSIHFIHRDAVRTSQKTQCNAIRKSIRWMLCREQWVLIVRVTDKLCGQNAGCLPHVNVAGDQQFER